MIAITNELNQTIRILADTKQVIGFHTNFGFLNHSAIKSRNVLRKHSGFKPKAVRFMCEFEVSKKGGVVSALPLFGCALSPTGDGRLSLDLGNHGKFFLSDADAVPVAADFIRPVVYETDAQRRIMAIGIALMLLILGIGVWNSYSKFAEEEESLTEELRKQDVVKIPVTVKKPEPVEKPKEVAKVKKSPPKVQSNQLAFLGVVGRKDLTKAIGGMPKDVPKVTAGAGPGGDSGSGGEMLMGLGKGLRPTTVGNTGMAGLGGLGHGKGPGGGAGGYGTGFMASGKGNGLGKVALTEAVELEGGLDKSVIDATVRKYEAQIRACYQRELTNNPGLAGNVTIAFEISGVGRLNYAKVKQTSLSNANVEDCIAKNMLTWIFPKPVGNVAVKVNYPFQLRPMGH